MVIDLFSELLLVVRRWFADFCNFNPLVGNFSFYCPLLIIGLITPAIGELGQGAGKLLAITALIAYISTLFSGFFTFFSCQAVFPHILSTGIDTGALNGVEEIKIDPFFTIEMPPVMDVMTALILSFCIGLGITFLKGDILQKAFVEFREIITLIIKSIIIPFLPLYIFGMFLSMTVSGQVYW